MLTFTRCSLWSNVLPCQFCGIVRSWPSEICLTMGWKPFLDFHSFMSLVAHSFRRVEFLIFVIGFPAVAVEKIKTNIRNLKFDMSKSMRYQGHKLCFDEFLRENWWKISWTWKFWYENKNAQSEMILTHWCFVSWSVI